MFCSACGKELIATAVVCPSCGSPTPAMGGEGWDGFFTLAWLAAVVFTPLAFVMSFLALLSHNASVRKRGVKLLIGAAVSSVCGIALMTYLAMNPA